MERSLEDSWNLLAVLWGPWQGSREPLDRSWALLDVSCEALKSSWRALERFWRPWESSWSLEASWDLLAASGAPLEALAELLEGSWSSLGAV